MTFTGRCLVGLAQCALVVAVLSSTAPAAPPTVTAWDARRQSFDDGWRFYKGTADGAEQQQFNDSKWRAIRLPHDWAIEGPFDPRINPHIGALPSFGTGWYRKTFVLPPSAKGKYFAVEFDGAMSNSQVWLNGHLLGWIGRRHAIARPTKPTVLSALTISCARLLRRRPVQCSTANSTIVVSAMVVDEGSDGESVRANSPTAIDRYATAEHWTTRSAHPIAKPIAGPNARRA